jgi:hypothetical protein
MLLHFLGVELFLTDWGWELAFMLNSLCWVAVAYSLWSMGRWLWRASNQTMRPTLNSGSFWARDWCADSNTLQDRIKSVATMITAPGSHGTALHSARPPQRSRKPHAE